MTAIAHLLNVYLSRVVATTKNVLLSWPAQLAGVWLFGQAVTPLLYVIDRALLTPVPGGVGLCLGWLVMMFGMMLGITAIAMSPLRLWAKCVLIIGTVIITPAIIVIIVFIDLVLFGFDEMFWDGPPL